MASEFTLRHRYGLKEAMTTVDIETLTQLVNELRTEKFEVPDEEHSQLSIENPSGHFLTLYRDGLLRLEKETANGFLDTYCAISSLEDALAQLNDFIKSTEFPSHSDRWFNTEQETPLEPHAWLE
jgi:hypothetical protein